MFRKEVYLEIQQERVASGKGVREEVETLSDVEYQAPRPLGSLEFNCERHSGFLDRIWGG